MSDDCPANRFNQSLSTAISSEEVFDALYQLTDEVVGVRLFTIMCVDMSAMLARRSYTSDPVSYPTSGTKPVEMNSWFDTVHGKQESFVANTLEDIAAVFPDHQLIATLGCGSVVNLPVILGGGLVATVNMLDTERHYTPQRVARIEQELRLPSLAAVLFDQSRR